MAKQTMDINKLDHDAIERKFNSMDQKTAKALYNSGTKPPAKKKAASKKKK